MLAIRGEGDVQDSFVVAGKGGCAASDRVDAEESLRTIHDRKNCFDGDILFCDEFLDSICDFFLIQEERVRHLLLIFQDRVDQSLQLFRCNILRDFERCTGGFTIFGCELNQKCRMFVTNILLLVGVIICVLVLTLDRRMCGRDEF